MSGTERGDLDLRSVCVFPVNNFWRRRNPGCSGGFFDEGPVLDDRRSIAELKCGIRQVEDRHCPTAEAPTDKNDASENEHRLGKFAEKSLLLRADGGMNSGLVLPQGCSFFSR